jgi:hypothetical protein
MQFFKYSYVALWTEAAVRVPPELLQQWGIGLIAVEPHMATILVHAPKLQPRTLSMNRLCSEALYRKARFPETNQTTSNKAFQQVKEPMT